MNEEFMLALDELEKDKNIDKGVILEALEKALIKSYQKNYDNAENVDVVVDKETGNIEVFALRTVVDEVNDNVNEISLKEANEIDKELGIGDVARIKIAPKNFGRVAAQTARNIVIQKIRDAQRDSVYGEYLDRENEMITGTIQREDKYNVYINLDKIEGVVPLKEQVASEKYIPNERMKFLIKDVKSSSKEPQIILSRASENLVKRLFELEVPEINDGTIEIYSIAREAGSRTKIAVFSNDDAIDAVGACIGYKGVRVNSIVDELQNEKIDIINYDKDIKVFISNALSPADIVDVLINEKKKQSLVVVNDYQLSLAIGKEGQNARLAARLTSWKIDIKSKEDFDTMSQEDIDQILGLVDDEEESSESKEEALAGEDLEEASEESLANLDDDQIEEPSDEDHELIDQEDLSEDEK
ncbi:transcription termination factor NusA [Anaerococcus sp. Marseille-Q7828]|uniref:transcription termination factor NusA n=1 Tax=Anaerococcus sp. Marseille-Q7828 TaxID=3036300 RepID=UPI0024AE1D96|nr:transcription termination factor NusA [Anaerococcus sp. Marseille-Q7828]